MTLQEVPTARRCGAMTRAGTPCAKWTLRGRIRCRNHGGASLRGRVHPGYRDGRYSSDVMDRITWWRIRNHKHSRDALYRSLRTLGWDEAKATATAWERFPLYEEEARL